MQGKKDSMSEFLKKYPVKLSELCFYIFFVSLLFAKGIGLYDGQAMFKVFLVIALCGWVMKQFFTDIKICLQSIFSYAIRFLSYPFFQSWDK